MAVFGRFLRGILRILLPRSSATVVTVASELTLGATGAAVGHAFPEIG